MKTIISMFMVLVFMPIVVFAIDSSEASDQLEYKIIATQKTSTAQKELNEASDAGFRFASVMGGETGWGGKEVVIALFRSRTAEAKPRYEYKLLTTQKTSTMQKELQEASDAGFAYAGQSVFESTFGGKEVCIILERDRDVQAQPLFEYKLLATNKTSTMQKELQEAGDAGFTLIGMTVSKTTFGGNEIVSIMRKKKPE